MRSKIVSRNHLNELGLELNLLQFVDSNISEENYGDNIHGNLFEALIGAMFLTADTLIVRNSYLIV